MIYKQNDEVALVKSDYPCMGDSFLGIDFPNYRCKKPCVYCGLFKYDSRERFITTGFKSVVSYLANNSVDGIYLSPYTDAFSKELSSLSHELLSQVLVSGLVVLTNTKQKIPDKTIDLLSEYSNQVIVQVSIPSLNEKLITEYEPGSASVKDRLETIKKLSEGGVSVTGLIMPWLNSYGLNESINDLPKELRKVGIKRVIASTGTFTNGTLNRLKKCKTSELKLSASKHTIKQKTLIGEGKTLQNKISAYSLLQDACENEGLKFRVCGTALNPDLLNSKDLPFKVCNKIRHRKIQ